MNRLTILLASMLLFHLLLAEKALSSLVQPDPEIKKGLDALFGPSVHIEAGEYPFGREFNALSARYGLPLPLVLGISRGESFFDPRAVSPKGAIGIMQVMPETAATYGIKKYELFEPKRNIEAGVRYLSDLLSRYKDPYLALGAYNCGPGGVDAKKRGLRADCDEYVQYIYSHIQKVLNAGRVGEPAGASSSKRRQRLLLAWFDHFLDARAFLELLKGELPGLEAEIFRKMTPYKDHYRFRYEVYVWVKGGSEGKRDLCAMIMEVTGFSFCSEKGSSNR